MDWTSLIIKLLLVAGLAIIAWYLTAGSNIATVAVIAAIAVGIWFAFFRKGGLSLGMKKNENGGNGNGARPVAKPATI